MLKGSMVNPLVGIPARMTKGKPYYNNVKRAEEESYNVTLEMKEEDFLKAVRYLAANTFDVDPDRIDVTEYRIVLNVPKEKALEILG